MLKYRIKMSLLVILLMPLLIGLGFWQLSRYEQKLDLEQMLQERLVMHPVSYAEARQYADPMYLPVTVKGQFDRHRYFFRDNQVYAGQAGYELLMPFVTDEGEWLLVNRGWVKSVSRDVFPDIVTPPKVSSLKATDEDSPKSEITLTGTLYRPLGKAFTLDEDHWAEGWPKRIQTIDFSQIQTTLGQKIPPMLFVLNEQQPGALQVRSLTLKTTSDKHLGYMFQWFTMALVLLGLYFYRMINYRKH